MPHGRVLYWATCSVPPCRCAPTLRTTRGDANSSERSVKSFALVLRWLTAAGGTASTRNVRIVVRLLLALLGMVAVYSVGFHWIMSTEGQRYSWPTAVYWVLVTMSTLGFGDITFESDLGRLFSVVVLLSGSMFILVLLPFTFIQFIFIPRIEARALARAPRRLPDDESGHVILTQVGVVEDALIRRLNRANVPYVVIEADLQRALVLHDEGYRVMVGSPDDPNTYRAARAESARLVAATRSDTANTNVAFTVREISPMVDIVAFASADPSVDILKLAGCNEVLQLGAMLGADFARRVIRPDTDTHVIGAMDDLLIAEASAVGTPIVGQTLAQTRLSEELGISVAGIWSGGTFTLASPDLVVVERSVLIVGGTAAQLAAYDARYSNDVAGADAPVIIIGGGRVGRSCGYELAAAGYEYRIIEQDPSRVVDRRHYVCGDAAKLDVLRQAGIDSTPAVVVTTHDDDMNVYLSIYCRRLRPDTQVLARANVDRNVSTLHRAGADVVLSYASSGATVIWNRIRPASTLMLAEGLVAFRVPVPESLVGRSIASGGIRAGTGCNVLAIRRNGATETNPDAHRVLDRSDELILVGDTAAEEQFFTTLGSAH